MEQESLDTLIIKVYRKREVKTRRFSFLKQKRYEMRFEDEDNDITILEETPSTLRGAAHAITNNLLENYDLNKEDKYQIKVITLPVMGCIIQEGAFLYQPLSERQVERLTFLISQYVKAQRQKPLERYART